MSVLLSFFFFHIHSTVRSETVRDRKEIHKHKDYYTLLYLPAFILLFPSTYMSLRSLSLYVMLFEVFLASYSKKKKNEKNEEKNEKRGKKGDGITMRQRERQRYRGIEGGGWEKNEL